MASLSVIFNAVDNISSKMSAMASAGRNAAKEFSAIEEQANAAFNEINSGAEKAGNAIEQAASSTGYWTEKVGNYDKSAMEAVRSTEELVNMGYKTQDALEAEASAAAKAADGINEVGEEAEDTAESAEEMGEKSQKAISDLEMLLAGAGIVAALKAISDAFAECAEQAEQTEYAYAKLETIAGTKWMGMLTEQIEELSKETGIAQADLADVAYNAISAGTSVEDAAYMAEQASKLAVAGFTDSAAALSVLTTTINAYGDAAGTAEQISDSLIMVQNRGVTTVADLADNMGKAIATASAYNVSLGNLESAYISTTKAGINTAESTTYISSMLKELGDSNTEVSKIIKEQTGESFGELMSQGYSLADVLGILYDSVNQNGEALMNLWGSAEAGKAANAIISQGLDEFNNNLIAVQNSAGATSDAYSIMADTTKRAHDKMNMAAENFRDTIGSQLNPTLENLYNIGAKVFDGLNSFMKKNPEVTAAVTGIVATVGTAVVVIGGYIVAQKAAALAVKLHTAAVATETTALLAKSAIIGGIAVGLAVMIAQIMSARNAEEELTASSQRQKEELEDLRAEYDNACATYGENSDEALKLKYQVDELNESYEASKMTLEEFYEQVDAVCNKHDELVEGYTKTKDSIRGQDMATQDLVSRLNELKESSDGSAASQVQMQSIVEKLSEMYPELGISIDDVNTNLDGLIARINTLTNASNKQAEYDNATENYAKLVAEQSELEEKKKEAYDNMIIAAEKYSDTSALKGTWDELWGTGAAKAYSEAQDAYNQMSDALEENIALQEECIETMEEYGDIVSGTSDEIVSAEDAVAIVLEQNKDKVLELATAYEEAYSSALTNISGQYELWETVGDVAATSIDKITSAMESQTQYWNEYAENLENLANRNIEGLDDLVASMDDGSENSAAALAAMAAASDEELAGMVASFQNLQDAQSKTASEMADLETDFKNSMDEIQSEMEDAVDKMNMEDDAAAAAKKTIQGYINGIKSMQTEAVSAAETVANATANALAQSASAAPKVPGHASGTLNSEKVYVAGENGPELIISGGGDTVFPHSETEKIVEAVTKNQEEQKPANIRNIDLPQDMGFENIEIPKEIGTGNVEIPKIGIGDIDIPQEIGIRNIDMLHDVGMNNIEIPTDIGIGNIEMPNMDDIEIPPMPAFEFEQPAEKDISAAVDFSDNPTITDGKETTSMVPALPESKAESEPEEKIITLRLEGGGSISVDKDTSKESLWENFKGKIKDTFMGILLDEIGEEGDGVYEF